MTNSVPTIAVAVVSYETRDLLDRCLQSLEPEYQAGRAEVWVVDNGSTDGSQAMVKARFGWARLVACERNLGFGAAVNLVADRTDTEWIAPANADVELTPGALQTLLRAGAQSPSAGAIAPRLRLPDGTTQHSVYHFPTVPFTLAFNVGARRWVPGLGNWLCFEGDWDPDRRRYVDWAIGAFLIVRRRAWKQAGGFDQEQWMYAEDLDLGWRLRRAGWHTLYEPDAVVHHQSAASTGPAFGEEIRTRWLRSTYVWMLRRRGPGRTRLTAGINVAGAAIRWLGIAPLALIRGGRFATRRRELSSWTGGHCIGLQLDQLGRQLDTQEGPRTA